MELISQNKSGTRTTIATSDLHPFLFQVEKLLAQIPSDTDAIRLAEQAKELRKQIDQKIK